MAILLNRGEEFYTLEDDEANSNFLLLLEIKIEPPKVKTDSSKLSRKSILRFKFVSYELAEIVRKRIFELLSRFDLNKNKLLE